MSKTKKTTTKKTKPARKRAGSRSPGTAKKTRRATARAPTDRLPFVPDGEGRVHFVTGYPGFIGKRLVERLARQQPRAKIYVLVQEKFEAEAERYVSEITRGRGTAGVEILVGDIIDMDLGLSGDEFRSLTESVTDVWHLAAVYYLGVRRDRMQRVNVDGTRRVLELCREMKRLRRLNYMSTAFVCGDRVGVIAEDELEMGQRFRNPYEETKYHAEVMVRDAMADLPISVYRPGIVVGDSRTGEIDRFDGPYYLGILLVTSPVAVPLPLPGDGVAPLNAVPVDFVVDAMLVLSERPEAEGRTFHLVDPNPMSSRRVYERIAERTGKRLPRMTLSYRLTDALMRLPGLERLIRQQRQAVAYVNHLAIFNSHNTLELLDGTGVRCPPLERYLDRLVDYVQRYYRTRRSDMEMEADPFDSESDAASSSPT
ncbi:MAG: NAD-dependent epimerase/dehydratase family protein [Deltaproteobacteria bacterium]|nr:MAG: NAD-dependent epimerase/dehydratase family protein [Deltaproteobacteria bacterium]